MYQRILVAVDSSEPAMAALDEVVNIASERARLVRLLHVVDLLHWHGAFAEGSVGDTFINSLRESGQKQIDAGKAVLSRHGLDCESILVEAHGERASAVIVANAKAWPADLIVMGTHGRRGISRAVLGSDAAEVVRAAPVPVLLVREMSQRVRS